MIIDLVIFDIIRRRMNFSLTKMDFHVNQMNGKERMASTLLDSQDVDSLACP